MNEFEIVTKIITMLVQVVVIGLFVLFVVGSAIALAGELIKPGTFIGS